MQQTKCLLCSNLANLKHEEFQGYQEGMLFKIYFCDTCYTSFSLPRINANEIYEAIYKNGDKVPGYNRYWNYYKEIKNSINPLKYLAHSEEAYWGIREALNKFVKNKENEKILELGSGLGYLTYALRKEKFNIKGLDISQEAVNKANSYFGEHYICQDLFDYSKTHLETYDVVILTEVIEHIESPIEFIDAITKILKPNGKIILTTPNRTLMTPDIIWDSDLPPVHHWWFSENSMKYISKKLNLGLSFVDYTKYYQEHHSIYNSKRKRKNKMLDARLDKDLKLTNEASPFKKRKNKFVYKIPFVKKIYLFIKTLSPKNKILFKERGYTLCAILTKSE